MNLRQLVGAILCSLLFAFIVTGSTSAMDLNPKDNLNKGANTVVESMCRSQCQQSQAETKNIIVITGAAVTVITMTLLALVSRRHKKQAIITGAIILAAIVSATIIFYTLTNCSYTAQVICLVERS